MDVGFRRYDEELAKFREDINRASCLLVGAFPP